MMNGNKALDILDQVRHDSQIRKIALSPELKPFPIHVFPKPLRDLIDSLHQANHFNPEFQAGAVLAIFAACAGNRFAVQVKRNWSEPLILWVPIVGDPSSLKTPTLKTYMRPLWHMEKTWQLEYEDEMRQYLQDKDDKRVAVPEQPQPKELILSSTTMEAIFKVHKHNQNGLLLFRDELLGWVKSMDQYRSKGSGDDQEMWLSIYNNEALKISRATQDNKMIDRASISVLGGVQPSVLSEMAAKAKEGNGFTYRLSFIFPQSIEVPMWTDKQADTGLIDQYHAAIARILTETPLESTIYMEMAPDTRQTFIGWYNANVELIRLLPKGDDMRASLYRKVEAMCLRLAGIIQAIKWSYNLGTRQVIEDESMHAAIEIAEYFRATSLKAHGVMVEADPQVERAADMYRDGMSIRQVAEDMRISKSQVSRWKRQNPSLFIRNDDLE